MNNSINVEGKIQQTNRRHIQAGATKWSICLVVSITFSLIAQLNNIAYTQTDRQTNRYKIFEHPGRWNEKDLDR